MLGRAHVEPRFFNMLQAHGARTAERAVHRNAVNLINLL